MDRRGQGGARMRTAQSAADAEVDPAADLGACGLDEGVAQADDLLVAGSEAVGHGGVLQGRRCGLRVGGLGRAVHVRLRHGLWGRASPARGLVALGDPVVNGGSNCLHGAVQGSVTLVTDRGGFRLRGEVREGEEWGACPLRSKCFLGLPAFQVGSERGPLGDLFGQSAAPNAACVGAGVEIAGFLRTSAGGCGTGGRGGGGVGQDAWRRRKDDAIKD